jgi:hypothetical protein
MTLDSGFQDVKSESRALNPAFVFVSVKGSRQKHEVLKMFPLHFSQYLLHRRYEQVGVDF